MSAREEILLDGDSDLGALVPSADARAPGASVALVAKKRMWPFGGASPSRATRCAALLVKGWTDLRAAEEGGRDVVFGVAPG